MGVAGFVDFILGIITNSSQEKMCRIHAKWLIAAMANQHTIWDRPAMDAKRDTMGTISVFRYGKHPISARCASDPQPARIVSETTVNFCPEAFFPRGLSGISREVLFRYSYGGRVIRFFTPWHALTQGCLLHIFSLGSKSKMLKDVDTRTMIAGMQNRHSSGNIPKGNHPGNTMGFGSLPNTEVLTYTVSSLIHQAFPGPAGIRATRAIDMAPKANVQRGTMLAPRGCVVPVFSFGASARFTPGMPTTLVLRHHIKLCRRFGQATLRTALGLHAGAMQRKVRTVRVRNIAGFTFAVMARGMRTVLYEVSQGFVQMAFRTAWHRHAPRQQGRPRSKEGTATSTRKMLSLYSRCEG